MSEQQGPRQPIEERDAEIERLRHQIKVKDAALQVARDWLNQFGAHAPIVFGGEEAVEAAILTALDCK